MITFVQCIELYVLVGLMFLVFTVKKRPSVLRELSKQFKVSIVYLVAGYTLLWLPVMIYVVIKMNKEM